MNKPYPFSEIGSVLASAQNIGILIPNDPEFDTVAASLALFLSLKRAAKNVLVASSTPMRVEFSHLVGLDKVKEKIMSGNEFVITIDYHPDNIQRVSYNDDGGKLNLVIQPKNGTQPVPKEKVNIIDQDKMVDLYFLIDGKDWSHFAPLVPAEEIQKQKVIVVSRHPDSKLSGEIKVDDPRSSSYSEIVTAILVCLSLPSDQDIAQNLYLGLSHTTANFSAGNISADTFEAAALCLRAGAKREPAPQIPLPTEKPDRTQPTKSPIPSPDWFQPKIYRGASLS